MRRPCAPRSKKVMPTTDSSTCCSATPASAEPISKIVDYPSDVFHRTLAVHIGGAFHVLKHGLPRMSDGGSVIITSSVVGLMGFADLSGYVAAKHGQVGLMRAAAKEVAGSTGQGEHPAPGPHVNRVPGRHRDDHDGRVPG